MLRFIGGLLAYAITWFIQTITIIVNTALLIPWFLSIPSFLITCWLLTFTWVQYLFIYWYTGSLLAYLVFPSYRRLYTEHLRIQRQFLS
jgi:hypothetical protein